MPSNWQSRCWRLEAALLEACAMTREFRLLVELCRLSFGGEGMEACKLAETVDWDMFLTLARHHRVEGLAARADALLPEPVRAQLKEAAADIAARNLHSAAQSKRLSDAFAAANIALLFVKGLTLGVLAYGDPSAKAAIDIDLLVAPGDIGRGTQVLADCGWKPVLPTERVEGWHRVHKESVWRSPATGLQADLHSRLADNPRLIPEIGVESAKQQVEVAPGIVLPTLAHDELFAYLSVHGASSAWFRLKWITDLAALLSPASGSELERLYARSQRLGAGRAAAQALLVADELYQGLHPAPQLATRLRAERANRRLAAIALKMLGRSKAPLEPTERTLGTLPIHLSQLQLRPGPGFKLGEAWRQARATLG